MTLFLGAVVILWIGEWLDPGTYDPYEDYLDDYLDDHDGLDDNGKGR
jgi:hypothetical protein